MRALAVTTTQLTLQQQLIIGLGKRLAHELIATARWLASV